MADKKVYYALPSYQGQAEMPANFTCGGVTYKGITTSSAELTDAALVKVYDTAWVDQAYRYININNGTAAFLAMNADKPAACFIFKTLKNCSLTNMAVMVESNSAYVTSIIADPGKEILMLQVQVLHNGIDITAQAYDSSTHTITVQSVQHNIDITAVISSIPIAYTEHDWIRNADGNQYIDTGITGKSGLSCEFTFNALSFTENTMPLGTRAVGGQMYEFHKNGVIYFAYAGAWNSAGNIAINTEYEISMISGIGSQTLIVNSETRWTGTSTTSFDSGSNIYLFRGNGTSGACVFKTRYLRMYIDGVLVRDMRPCVRNSDSKPGMYDVVTGAFYTNSGTGELICGDD